MSAGYFRHPVPGNPAFFSGRDAPCQQGGPMFVFHVATTARSRMHDITAEVRTVLRQALAEHPGPRSGALALFCPHTTCGLTINEGADPDVCRDMEGFFNRLVPQSRDFAHAEGNSDAHIKCTLHGPSLLVLVEDGQLQLGTWQAIYLCEGDGPRRRSVWAQWLPGPSSR